MAITGVLIWFNNWSKMSLWALFKIQCTVYILMCRRSLKMSSWYNIFFLYNSFFSIVPKEVRSRVYCILLFNFHFESIFNSDRSQYYINCIFVDRCIALIIVWRCINLSTLAFIKSKLYRQHHIFINQSDHYYLI